MADMTIGPYLFDERTEKREIKYISEYKDMAKNEQCFNYDFLCYFIHKQELKHKY
jgi:hypothetical protein